MKVERKSVQVFSISSCVSNKSCGITVLVYSVSPCEISSHETNVSSILNNFALCWEPHRLLITLILQALSTGTQNLSTKSFQNKVIDRFQLQFLMNIGNKLPL